MKRKELLAIVKPVLFNTEMVQAEQRGSKTATRRIVKPQPKSINDIIYKHPENGKWFISPDNDTFSEVEVKPKYKVGDILYVRETWLEYDADHIIDGVKYAYKADSTPASEETREQLGYKWHPSIHMPKEAARIFLRVTNVRVERLQDMTELDVCAEGAEDLVSAPCEHPVYYSDGVEMCYNTGCCSYCVWLSKSYPELFGEYVWNKTIKKSDLDKYGWNANPWVWVYEFQRLEVDSV